MLLEKTSGRAAASSEIGIGVELIYGSKGET